MAISIILIEDHSDFRESLSFLLNSNEAFRCNAYSKAEDALEKLDEDIPDVVIMDINLPGMSGIDCTKRIKLKYPEIQVLMCTVNEDDEKIFQALQAGANGYLLKRSAIDEIFSSINDICNGGSPMTPLIARKVVSSFKPHPDLTTQAATLSTRENEILDLLAEGRRIKEIADKIFVSVNTVRTHIRHIYDKLQVNSRVEALNKSRRNLYQK